MQKGISALAVGIILAAIIGFIFVGSQFINPPPPIKYKNDIITVEEFYVSNTKPYEGSEISVDFKIKNNGDNETHDVIVRFADIPGFDKIILDCGVGGIADSTGRACNYDTIDIFDTKHISAILKATSGIPSDTPVTIRYTVQYYNKGFRIANVPIIDQNTRKQPISKFSQSTPSYGPVVLDFQPGELHEFVVEGKTISGYWGVFDSPLEVKFSFKSVATSSVGKANDTIIGIGHIKVDTRNTLERGIGPCNFDQENGVWFSDKAVKVPNTLVCNFKPAGQLNVPEITATIAAEFDYVYKYERTQQITIQKIPNQ